MADQTHLHFRQLKAALEKFDGIGIQCRKNGLEETLTMTRIFMHIGVYFMAPMRVLFLLMTFRSRKQRGIMLGSQSFTNRGALSHLN
jgi:hypothetical protein